MTGRPPSVVVMTRAPLPGATKTRLAPMLGVEGCARLHRALIAHTLAAARDAVGDRCVVVAVDPPEHMDLVGALARPVARHADLITQSGADLGERMAAAVGYAYQRHGSPVVVVGTDLPSLTPALITGAACAVAAGADVVFGPALDGGYYLVGLARPTAELFALPPELWGGPAVLSASLDRATALGLRFTTLAPQRDLDTPKDLLALAREGALPPVVAAATRATLAGSCHEP